MLKACHYKIENKDGVYKYVESVSKFCCLHGSLAFDLGDLSSTMYVLYYKNQTKLNTVALGVGSSS